MHQGVSKLAEALHIDDGAIEVLDNLMQRYSEPWRYYHNQDHLFDMTNFLIDNKDHITNMRTVLWSAIGHDAVYIAQEPNGVNEDLSAQLTELMLQPYLAPADIKTIVRYIRSTADHECDGSDTDQALFLDSDMKILGASKEEFDEYERNIAREYQKRYTKLEYRTGRLAVLKYFQLQDSLFISDIARDQFEEKARQNISRSIDKLKN